jgi:RNA-directed DNA polymerase
VIARDTYVLGSESVSDPRRLRHLNELQHRVLGHRLLPGGGLGIAPQSLDRAKERVRQITRRNRGVSLPEVIGELNRFLIGWVAYFRHAACKSHLQRMDEWIRRKLRCLRLKERKRTGSIAEFLHELGVPKWRTWIGALSGKGWWRQSGSPPAMEGMTLAWFESLGLVSLVQRYEQLNR